MAIILKKGLESNRASTSVAEGEMLFSKDTGRIYVGSGSGNLGGQEIKFFQLSASAASIGEITASNIKVTGTIDGTVIGSIASSSYAATASYLLGSIQSASYALTASNVSWVGVSGKPSLISSSVQFSSTDNFGVGQITSSGNILIQSENTASRITLLSSGTVSLGNAIFASRVSGQTLASPTQTLQGHYTSWQMQTYGGTTWSTAARMLMTAYGDHLEDSRPTNIIFATVSSGSSTLSDRLRVNGTGVQVTGSLGVSGDTNIVGSLTASIISASFITASNFYVDTLVANVTTMSIDLLLVTSDISADITGSVLGTSSWAISSVSSSYATTASYAIGGGTSTTASYALTASYVVTALTASYVLPATIVSGLSGQRIGVADITASAGMRSLGNIGYYGSIGGQINFVASSVSSVVNTIGSYYNAGSNFAPLVVSAGTNIQHFISGTQISDLSSTGLIVTGSVLATTGFTGTSSWASQARTASYVVTANTASYVTLSQTASYVVSAVTASYVTQAQTASYVLPATVVSSLVGQNVNVSTITASIISASYITASNFYVDTLVANITTMSIDLLIVSSPISASLSGSVYGTSSWATNAITASYVTLAQTASYILPTTVVSSLSGQRVSVSDITASNALFTNLNVTVISSSVEYASGSNIFGTNQTNTHRFTGSVSITGSFSVNGNITNTQGVGYSVLSTTTATATSSLTSTSATIQIFTGTLNQQVNLPAANVLGSGIGSFYIIKNRSTGNVTVKAAGADLIDGFATSSLSTTAALTMVSDGSTNWEII